MTKKTKLSHRAIALFLVCTFLPSLFPINYVFASNNGPTAPEAASFEPIDAPDMVNLSTGDLSYVMPLLNIPSPEGGYPLALSYHAGIAMSQEASWVGLGWNLNPGAINRTISGVPDDWKRREKHSIVYDAGGVSKSIEVGSSYGLKDFLSIGDYYSYSSNKTFGGETTHSFDYGHKASIGPLSGRLGTDGVGLSINVAKTWQKTNESPTTRLSLGVSAYQSFKGKGLRTSASLTLSHESNGISLSSSGSLSAMTDMRTSHSLGGGSSSGSNTHINAINLYGSIPVGPAATLDFGFNRTRYWVFDNDYSVYNGSLYAGDIGDLLYDSVIDTKIGLDSYQGLYKHNQSEQQRGANFSYISYDNYQVLAQGLSGSISPKILELGTLIRPEETIRTGNSSFPKAWGGYKYPNSSNNEFSKSLDASNLHFYFDNEYSSHLKINSGDWNAVQSGSNYSDIQDFQTSSKTFDSTTNIDGVTYDGYSTAKNRMRKGNYVQAFTNEELINNPNLILSPSATGFNRSASWIPSEGIGGYQITAADGKVYHYAIPVYQKEQFSRTTPIDEDSELRFREEQQFEPYATHWLLTAVTGPDYVDNNGNNYADEGDYGYWVDFEYGKWSDGYVWRTPTIDYNSNEKVKSYAWGIKEVYYLDRAKTRTHTALFVKGVRKDNLSSEIVITDEDNASEPRGYEVPATRSVVKGDDNKWYFEGLYGNKEVPDPPAYYSGSSELEIYANTNQLRSLRLEKVILLKNEHASISKFNPSASQSALAGRLYVNEKQSIWRLFQSFPENYDETSVEDHSWYGEFFNNIIDQQDITNNNSDIENDALKVINFGYDETYPLGANSANSIAPNKGRLTLQSITTGGKTGKVLIPPYSFDYANKNEPFNKNAEDAWGYHEGAAMNWSLNKIKTPTGGEINITYENDEYIKEAAIHRYVFDHNIQVQFTGTGNGSKKISFRNDPENDEDENTDFTKYFTAGQTSQIDVLFWHNPNNPGTNWIADVAADCLVDTVSSDEVTFSLPTNSSKTTVRADRNCTSEDWVFYEPSEYNHVVDFGWTNAKSEGLCDSPANGDNKLRFRFYSNKELLNHQGGGIRVKEIAIKDLGSKTYKTRYSYLNPQTNQESGITTYAPSIKEKEILFVSEIPSPGVMYEYVTVEELSSNNQVNYKNRYHFEVPKAMQLTSTGASMGDAFEYTVLQDDSSTNVTIGNETADMNFYKAEVTNNVSSLGRLISTESYNSMDQLLFSTRNEYLSYSAGEIKQGILQETFDSYKRLGEENETPQYLLSSSSKTIIPNVLKRTITNLGGHEFISTFDKHDFLTGSVLESTTSRSDGTQFKTEIVPAYHRYTSMGSIVDTNSGALYGNENMLTQQAITKTLVEHNGSWEETGIGITTWKPENYSYNSGQFTVLDAVWRKHKTYVWDSQIDSDGLLTGYSSTTDGGFDFSDPAAVQPSPWKQLTNITSYNEYSMPLEVVDINGNEVATKMGDDDEKVFAIGTAAYDELFYSGAEDIALNGIDFGGDVQKGNASFSTDAHTGSQALQIASGQSAFELTVNNGSNPERQYKISLWAKANNYTNTKVNVGGSNINHSASELVRAGDWVQMNFYTSITGQKNIHVTAEGGSTIVDDFRVHPIDASLTSYVYNEWDELTHIIGPNNMASQYKYDEAGRLIETLTEVVDFNGEGTGGFKRISENQYSYKYTSN